MITICILSVISILANQPEIYSQIRVDWTDIGRIHNEPVYVRPGVWAEFALTESELAELDFHGIPYDVIIRDMTAYYVSRFDAMMDMGGWRTYEMQKAALDSLHDTYPAYVSEPESIGAGWDGNAIWVVKISDNVDIDEDEPEVLIGLGIHAREPIAMEIVLEFAQWLMESYGTDEVAAHLVDDREIWIVPLMNPDGYRYNEIIEPDGGGMWRKNRRNNGGGLYGVDLNRNFPYMWGYDDYGSSPDPSEETYRGPSAASEPETQAILELVNSRDFRTSLGFHSWSNLYLSPWGYTYDLCDDHNWFMRIMYRYARNNNYIYGPGASVIYRTNGDTDDWFYGDTTERNKILAVTPEVGGYDDGFWPPLWRKPELVAENMPACIVCCQVAGSAPFMTSTWVTDSTGDTSGYADPGETARLKIEVENLGYDPTLAYIIPSAPISGVSILTDTAWTELIPSQGYDTTYVDFILDPVRFDAGDLVRLDFEIRDTSGHLTFDSTSFICGTPFFFAQYDFEADDGSFIASGDWEWGEPTTGPEEAYSGLKLWATRLDSNYRNDRESILLIPPVIIPDSCYKPMLSFVHWYSFEAPSAGDVYDGGTVRISTNSGSTWEVLNPINGYDGEAYSGNDYVGGDSVFTANSGLWKHEHFDLSAYEGMTVEIALVMGSDPYVTEDGWYVDDVAFLDYIETGMTTTEISKPARPMIEISPNPFNTSTKIDISVGDSREAELSIYNTNGKLVRRWLLTDNTHSITWDGRDDSGKSIPTGVYLLHAKTGDTRTNRKLLLLK